MARLADPLVGFRFALEIPDVTGYFSEVSGIRPENPMTVQKIMTPEGREFHLQLPERVECGEVTLKRGLTTDTGLWDWREKVVTGNVTEARVDCTITMFDSENMPVVTWKLVNAWPSRISGPHIGLDSNDFAVEELIIVHEGLYWHDGVDSMPMFEPAD